MSLHNQTLVDAQGPSTTQFHESSALPAESYPSQPEKSQPSVERNDLSQRLLDAVSSIKQDINRLTDKVESIARLADHLVPLTENKVGKLHLAKAKRSTTLVPELVNDQAAAGLTVANVARRYRVSPDKVRAWIKSGQLAAINTAAVRCGKPRFVIPPNALAQFEKSRSAEAPEKPARRKKRRYEKDYYPE